MQRRLRWLLLALVRRLLQGQLRMRLILTQTDEHALLKQGMLLLSLFTLIETNTGY